MNRTPLHLAASQKQTETVADILIANGADINANSKSYGTPLHIAASCNHKKIAELLINKGANVNAVNALGTPLHVAARHNNAEIAEILIAGNANVNDQNNSGGQTPLHDAASWGDIEVAEILIANGAQVNLRNFSGNTPISKARSRFGNRYSPDLINLLISHGAME